MANGFVPGQQQARPGGLVSLYEGILGLTQGKQRRAAAQQYIDLIGQTLRSHGTEEANQFADQWYQNPQGFYFFMQQMGGLNALNTMLEQHAIKQKASQALAGTGVDYPQLVEALGPEKAAEFLKNTREGFEPYERPVMKGAGDLLYYTDTGEVVPGQEEAPYKPQTQVEKLQEALRRARERGDEKAAKEIENALVRAQYGSQTDISWGPEGGSVTIGPKIPGQSATTPTPVTLNRLQQAEQMLTDQISRTKGVRATYDPRYYETGYQLWGLWEEAKTKYFKGTLDPAEEKELRRMWIHQRRAWEHHNLTLREISGVAVNPQESVRIKKQMINPGDSPFTGDSPPKAKAKLDDGIVTMCRHKARVVYALKHPGAISAASNEYGYKFNIGLDEIYKIMSEFVVQKSDEIQKEYPRMNQEGMRKLIDSEVVREFGVSWYDVQEPEL